MSLQSLGYVSPGSHGLRPFRRGDSLKNCEHIPRSAERAFNTSTAQRRRDGGERRFGLAAVRAAGLRHVGPAAAALAAEHFGALADEIDRVEAFGQIVGDADDDAGLAVVVDADDGDDAGADLFLPSSARPLRSFVAMPVIARASNLTSPTVRTP